MFILLQCAEHHPRSELHGVAGHITAAYTVCIHLPARRDDSHVQYMDVTHHKDYACCTPYRKS
jgi:hypothetical protein